MSYRTKRSNASIFEHLRQLIGADELTAAFTIAVTLLEGHRERDDIILLQGQFKHWEKNASRATRQPQHERNRIRFALLSILTEVELQIEPKLLRKKQRDIEKMLEKQFQKMANLENTFTQTDDILIRLRDADGARFDQLTALAADLVRSKGNLPDGAALIRFWTEQAATSQALSSQDTHIIQKLLLESPGAIVRTANERRHRNATIRRLEKEVDHYRRQYEKVKTAGIAGLAGVAIGTLLAKISIGTNTGNPVNSEGYNIRGYDADGYDRYGFDENGHSFIEGFERADFPDFSFFALPFDGSADYSEVF